MLSDDAGRFVGVVRVDEVVKVVVEGRFCCFFEEAGIADGGFFETDFDGEVVVGLEEEGLEDYDAPGKFIFDCAIDKFTLTDKDFVRKMSDL